MSSKLSDKVEEIIDLLIEGKTYRFIAEKYGVSLSTLHDFMNSNEHSARTRSALEISASSYADKAEEVLIQAERDKIEIQRARELAQHYRWKAGKRNPKKYGDKMDLTTDGEKISQVVQFQLPNNNRDE